MTCPFCGGETRRTSTPTIHEDGHKEHTRHVDTGMNLCPERIAGVATSG